MPADQPAGRIPARRPDHRSLAHRTPPVTPVHHGREFEFTDNQGREYWWDQLSLPLRRRMLDRTGEIIEWWAYVYGDLPDRPYAVVLGQRGFAISRPTINRHGGPASQLLVWSLREASHRYARVTGVSPAAAGGGAAPGPAGAARPAAGCLPEHFRGFLGNLPPEAQQRLQQPFVAGDQVRECEYYYSGWPEGLDIWCFLAGSRSVTFASGTGRLVPGRPRAYTWELRCRRVDVAGSGH
jgi:hypothetical protein